MIRIATTGLALALLISPARAQDAAKLDKETEVKLKERYIAGNKAYYHAVVVESKPGDRFRIQFTATAGATPKTSVRVLSQTKWSGKRDGLKTSKYDQQSESDSDEKTDYTMLKPVPAGRTAIVLIASEPGDFKYRITKVSGADR